MYQLKRMHHNEDREQERKDPLFTWKATLSNWCVFVPLTGLLFMVRVMNLCLCVASRKAALA